MLISHNFRILEKSVSPENNPWQTLFKSVLLVHTIVLYGSEKAVDAAIAMCPAIYKLREYNSALIRRSIFSQSKYDNGLPVRRAADTLYTVLMSDDGIRNARMEAREGQNTLVPLGTAVPSAQAAPAHFFGQGVEQSIGAGFDLSAVPGMYEGRPERYFDNDRDIRKCSATGDHQFTREVCICFCVSVKWLDCPCGVHVIYGHSLSRPKVKIACWIWSSMRPVQTRMLPCLPWITCLPFSDSESSRHN